MAAGDARGALNYICIASAEMQSSRLRIPSDGRDPDLKSSPRVRKTAWP
jgi:hypothetical protein